MIQKNPDSFETVRKIDDHQEKSGSFWKYWDSLKGFFCYTRKNFPDAQNFLGSNATLLTQVFGPLY